MAFPLLIFSIDREIFVGQADSLRAPGVEGEFQVLTDHTPMMSLLKEGNIIIEYDSGKEQKLPIKSGVVEVTPKEVTALVNF